MKHGSLYCELMCVDFGWTVISVRSTCSECKNAEWVMLIHADYTGKTIRPELTTSRESIGGTMLLLTEDNEGIA